MGRSVLHSLITNRVYGPDTSGFDFHSTDDIGSMVFARVLDREMPNGSHSHLSKGAFGDGPEDLDNCWQSHYKFRDKRASSTFTGREATDLFFVDISHLEAHLTVESRAKALIHSYQQPMDETIKTGGRLASKATENSGEPGYNRITSNTRSPFGHLSVD